MTLRAIAQEISRFCTVAFFCITASFPLTTPATADAGQPAQGNEAGAETDPRTFFWIRDPWTGETVLSSYLNPDQSLWDATQIKDYEEALRLLIINDLNIEVPIYNGTEEHILDRGAGRIKGMAKMDEDGNLGISAHRDSFFRGLKDIELGDVVLVQSAHGVEKYAVSDVNIVPKEDVSVLAPVEQKTLTLVTCYPFYHVGAAPQRFIVTALPVPDVID